MKSIISLFIISLAFVSCIKEPTACIDGPEKVRLFETAQFTSCSENAETISWELETHEESVMKEGAAVTHMYERMGSYGVNLTASSKKDKKKDYSATTVEVLDYCYTCTGELLGQETSYEVCASDFNSLERYNEALTLMEDRGFTCVE